VPGLALLIPLYELELGKIFEIIAGVYIFVQYILRTLVDDCGAQYYSDHGPFSSLSYF
jgi:hypothetical protein